VSEPTGGNHKSCNPFFAVKDDDYAWPTDAFKPFVAMAEVRLISGNPDPPFYSSSM
jgi:hypothetical protein